MFSVWKAGVKRRLSELHDAFVMQNHAERMAHLTAVGEIAIEDVTNDGAEKARNFFRHVQGRLPQCFMRDDVFM